MRGRTGVTLVEIMVALAVVALLNGSAILAIRSLRPPDSTAQGELMASARARAVLSGKPVQLVAGTDTVLLLPDGRVIGQWVGLRGGSTRETSR